jgi:pilus assembly protein Flp/PilA
MKKFSSNVCRFVMDEEGATAVEYGMMVGLIAVAVIATVVAIGTQLNTLFTSVKDCLITPASCV